MHIHDWDESYLLGATAHSGVSDPVDETIFAQEGAVLQGALVPCSRA